MGKAARLKRERDANERAFLRWTSTMCGGCAYRPGTEANTETGDPGLTKKRLLLLDAGQVFYCHEPMPAGVCDPYPNQHRKGGLKACVGHMNALQVRLRKEGDVDYDEFAERQRTAIEEFKRLDASIWQCRCGWNVTVGDACPNPAHARTAEIVAKTMEAFR